MTKLSPQSIADSDKPHQASLAGVFAKLTQQLLQEPTLDTVLNTIYDRFKSFLPFSRIGCALIDESGERVVSRWCRSERPVILDYPFSAPLKGSSLQIVLEQKRPRLLNNLEEYLTNHPHSASTRLIVDEGFRSSYTIPLIAEEHNIGFLFFSSTELNAYSETHIDLLTDIAGKLSLSILIAMQRDRVAKSHCGYIDILNTLVRSMNPRSEYVIRLVSGVAQVLSPKYVKHCEIAALLTEASDVISANDHQEQRSLASIVSGMPELDTASRIIDIHDKQSDILSLQNGDFRDDSLALGANIIRTVRQYKYLESLHSNVFLPIAHLQKEAEKFAPIVVEELERRVSELVGEIVRRVSVKELADGMVIKEHVISSHGEILLSKNYIVDEKIKRKLMAFGSCGNRVVEPLLVTLASNQMMASE